MLTVSSFVGMDVHKETISISVAEDGRAFGVAETKVSARRAATAECQHFAVAKDCCDCFLTGNRFTHGTLEYDFEFGVVTLHR